MTPNTPTPPAVQITRIFKVPAASQDRFGQEDVLVEYALKGTQIMTVRVDKPNATATDIEAAVRADAARFLPLIGKTLQV